MAHHHRLIALPWIDALRAGGAVALVLWFVAGTLGVPGAPPVAYAFVLAPLLAASAALTRPWGGRAVSDARVAAAIAVDIVALTALIVGTEGSGSPYALLYIFPVVLAGMALPDRHAWVLLGLAIALYGSLFLVAPANLHHHDEAAMQVHLVGMWVTVSLVGALTVSSFGRMRHQIAKLDRQLQQARDLEARNARLGALATLAAGAAHELATPLSTILLVAKETQLRATDPRAREDATLVADEVARCQEVLSQLTLNAGEGLGEAPTRLALGPFMAQAVAPLADARLIVNAGNDAVFLPARLLAQVVRRLAGNALAASAAEQPVTITASIQAQNLVIHVHDEGCGMTSDVLARAGEPFFTTRPPGEGRGLGLYFVRSVCSGLGGSLDVQSAPGRGTDVRVTLPVEVG